MKLNIGCGTDYREGFVNIDGSHNLEKVDKVIDISKESLLSYFNENSIDFILANDIVEHLFHWEAVRLLEDFYKLLNSGGACEIRVPDCEYIIEYAAPIEEKLLLLFGGQDIPQENNKMNESRKQYPQFFCHKYGWTHDRMEKELSALGFKDIIFIKEKGVNFITIATK